MKEKPNHFFKYSIYFVSFATQNNFKMNQHLLRRFEGHAASSLPFTELWVRVISCLTLLIPLVTSLTVGRKTKETSDRHILATTPPDYFFRIWIIIFLLEVFVMVDGAIQDCWNYQIWIYFSVINICCGIWAFTFNSGHLWGVDISILCQWINLAMNQLIWIEMGSVIKNNLAGTSWGIIIRNLVAFFNGWFIAAAALGLFIVLVYNFGVSLKTQLYLFWVAAPLVYGAFLVYNIFVIGTITDTIGMFFSMGWAVLGAFIASRNYLATQK